MILLKRAVQNRNSRPLEIAILLKRPVQNRDSVPPGNRDDVRIIAHLLLFDDFQNI